MTCAMQVHDFDERVEHCTGVVEHCTGVVVGLWSIVQGLWSQQCFLFNSPVTVIEAHLFHQNVDKDVEHSSDEGGQLIVTGHGT